MNISKEEYRSQAIGDFEISAKELQPIRFQGQSFDSETGLHYNRFRYYDPDLGMFISRDPERGLARVWGTLARSARRRAVLVVAFGW